MKIIIYQSEDGRGSLKPVQSSINMCRKNVLIYSVLKFTWKTGAKIKYWSVVRSNILISLIWFIPIRLCIQDISRPSLHPWTREEFSSSHSNNITGGGFLLRRYRRILIKIHRRAIGGSANRWTLRKIHPQSISLN